MRKYYNLLTQSSVLITQSSRAQNYFSQLYKMVVAELTLAQDENALMA
jgi:hypothetical protein